ncbi:hypothetical protein DFH09DRAFT_1099460 [Mycena vulgaris]|nr:hypothetical protein DFH09DRAFT_1099460 [Mycena vulgaris]
MSNEDALHSAGPSIALPRLVPSIRIDLVILVAYEHLGTSTAYADSDGLCEIFLGFSSVFHYQWAVRVKAVRGWKIRQRVLSEAAALSSISTAQQAGWETAYQSLNLRTASDGSVGRVLAYRGVGKGISVVALAEEVVGRWWDESKRGGVTQSQAAH